MHFAMRHSLPTKLPKGRWGAVLSIGLVALGWLVEGIGFGAERAPDISKLPPPVSGRAIDFAREIQPLFEARCYGCHGPEKQKGGFRIDQKRFAWKGGESYSAPIVASNSAASPLIHLVAGLVPDLRMPQKGEPLTTEQIALLRGWIDQGAPWPSADSELSAIETHWSFRPVVRPKVPHLDGQAEGSSNPIDAFVRAALAEKHLAPSPEADRSVLLRRLYFTMLGVPPTPEELDAFLADPDPQAFEKKVDQVLADSRYGERWGRHWLDVIRFAESNGFETNRERPNAWRFRDYIIAAFNQDKPYDQFIREQLAGDAYGVDVATGFLVGGPVDIVGSPDPVLTAQQRADELDDMVSTTGTAFLGLTLGCARCHNHKFDPVEQREYYSLTALLNGVKHGERALPLPKTASQEVERWTAVQQDLEKKLSVYLKTDVVDSKPASNTVRRVAVNARRNEDAFPPVQTRAMRFTILGTSSAEPCLDEVEVWSGSENVALASHGTKASASGTLPGYAIHQVPHLNDGKVGNDHSWISNEPGKGWVRLDFPKAETIDRVVWGRDREERFADRVVTDYVIEVLVASNQWKTVSRSVDREPFQPKASKPKPPTYHFEGLSEAEAAQGQQWLKELERARKAREAAAKSDMVYAGQFVTPAAAYRLHRGDPMQKREPVVPGTLSIYHPLQLSTNAPEQERRVRLAEWISSREHPLTARVFVNRIWQHHFGVGLVETPNDFGRNGARPSHPELLDWLADEFMARNWSVKAIQRWILLSATWRQANTPRPEAMRIDAGNRLLWRFRPLRLEAEAIRDTILAVSGNLDSSHGGPSFYLHDVDRENVYHYHPKESFGPSETRRMVYAFKVRMEQDGIFGAFDCPDGSLVAPKRSVSTTPLQALNLFNSRFMIQQADVFAERVRREAGAQIVPEIQRCWKLAFGRAAQPDEIEEASSLVQRRGLSALTRAVLNANELVFIP